MHRHVRLCGQMTLVEIYSNLEFEFKLVLQDFTQRLMRLMLHTDGRQGCPFRAEIEKMIEARRWSVLKVLEHNPERMMRIAMEVRSQRMECAADPAKQRSILVSGVPSLLLFKNWHKLNLPLSDLDL